jgi:protein OS-9
MDRCIYFISGWWSYSFCYNKQIKQFHQLPPGNGAPPYPPTEDPTTPSYILGKFPTEKKDKTAQKASEDKPGTDVALQTKGESRYLVQKLSGGTICDLTGKERRIEVQFHCHPQSPERIGWIREVATCSYLMVIYTPRLCNDVAFLPPREDKANPITCQEIVTEDGMFEWQARMSAKASRRLNSAPETRQVIGGIEVGAMKLVGREGKRIEKGKVASSNQEKSDVVAKREGGEVKRLSTEDLKKMALDPETVEALKKKLQEMAGDKDWKLELVDVEDGARELRGIVQANGEETENQGEEDGEGRDTSEGSQEGLQEEL